MNNSHRNLAIATSGAFILSLISGLQPVYAATFAFDQKNFDRGGELSGTFTTASDNRTVSSITFNWSGGSGIPSFNNIIDAPSSDTVGFTGNDLRFFVFADQSGSTQVIRPNSAYTQVERYKTNDQYSVSNSRNPIFISSVTVPPVAEVPEPSEVLGVLALGFIGLVSRFQRKSIHQKNAN